MTIKIQSHPTDLNRIKKDVCKWKMPTATQADMLQFVAGLEVGRVNRGKRISEGRQARYLYLLRVPLEFFNKTISKISPADVERFERALNTDQIVHRTLHRPLAAVTKADVRKALKVFLRWRLGEAKALRLAGWLDTHDPKKTPEFMTEPEVEQLYRHCRTTEQRFAVAILFDTGARAEEFINIRYEDIHLPEGRDNFVKVTLKEEYSKTKGRTISLYWRHTAEAVTEYLKERIAAGITAKDPVYRNSYNGLRMFLGRLGKRTLKRHVHPHLFRHSSATYYATKLNRQELCYRYGWRFSSPMPDVYISRSGMEHKELDMKFTNTEIGDLKDDLAKLQQETKIKDDKILRLESSLTELQNNFQMVSEILQRNPSIADVEAALLQKKGKGRLHPDLHRDSIQLA